MSSTTPTKRAPIKDSKGAQVVKDLSELVEAAKETERYERLAQHLLERNKELQDQLHRLSNLIGQYIVANGPIKVDLRGIKDDLKFEIFSEPSDEELGIALLNAIKVESEFSGTRKGDIVFFS